MSPIPPAADRPAADAGKLRKKLLRHLDAIERAMGADAVLNQTFPNSRIVDYYDQCFDAYGKHHSPEGALHLSLNPDGKYHPDGLYGQPKEVERQMRERGARDVLELAFGKGFNLAYLGGRFPQVNFEGIDLTPRHVAHAQAQIEKLGLSNVRVREADFQRLPFGDGQFDHLFCVCALCYTPDLRQALSEQLRVLRPGGRITLYDLYRTRPPQGYDPQEAAATALVEKAMAVEQFAELEHILAVAQSLGLKVVHNLDLNHAVMPNLLRFEKRFRAFFGIAALARLMLARQAPLRGKNAVAGLLMAPTLQLGLLRYGQLTFEKPAAA